MQALAICQRMVLRLAQAVRRALASPPTSRDESMKHALFAGLGAALLTAGPAAAQGEFAAYLDGFEAEAGARGYDPALVESLFAEDAAANTDAVRLSQAQPEFIRPVWEYLDGAVSDQRVADGFDRMAANAPLLEQIEQRYGVSRHALVAIWGLESAYGAVQGDHDAPTALATLGWSGWRPDFVKEELFHTLDILRDGQARREQLKGSWAGAMGQTQFMPSSYRRFAQDWNGDGLKDVWSSNADALASAAHYLKEAGWITGATAAAEVSLPAGFDWATSEQEKTVREWLLQGVQRTGNMAWSPEDVELTARLIAPAGASGPAFLTTDNFRVIMAYNNSTSYALAVSLLAQRLAGGPGVLGEWPRTEPPLSVAEAEEIQRLLIAQGYDTQGVDGAIGPNTRAAIRAWQAANGMTPDGAASAEFRTRLRGGAASVTPAAE
jgi:membrane-bound lytic murein transglycosylase B